MKSSRIALYLFIALIALSISYYILVKEPSPGQPINLIHLLARH